MDTYRLEEEGSVEPGVLLGHPTGREIRKSPLVLGKFHFIRSGTILYEASKIGDHFETGHYVVVREEVEIGDHVRIWNFTTIDYGVVIGNQVKIHNHCYIAQHTRIENDVFIAPGVKCANDLFPESPHLKGPLIKSGARVGVGVVLLLGVVLGENSLIGSGSVVSRSIPPYSIAFGNPAKIRGDVRKITEEDRKRHLQAWT